MPSRRDLLVSFLGLAAANACRRAKVEPRPVPGALVDRVHEVGHLLRGPPLPRAPHDTGRHDVVIIGADTAGLSAFVVGLNGGITTSAGWDQQRYPSCTRWSDQAEWLPWVTPHSRSADAMWVDALRGSLLCMDATGVLVQAKEKCRKAHFFVVIAPGQ
ncbi:MAG: hypothetical protein IT380_29620, partial [Myxococcales bacterium]|nr:hypothetical protein [Myxococcales bacterium]